MKREKHSASGHQAHAKNCQARTVKRDRLPPLVLTPLRATNEAVWKGFSGWTKKPESQPKRKAGGKSARVEELQGSGWLAAACAAASAGASPSTSRTRHGAGLHRQQAFALQLLAGELAGPANRLGLLARLLFRRLFVMTAKLHLAENALALHLFLERLESLIDVIIANENLHPSFLLIRIEWIFD
jgi:hypothetical protein